SHFLTHRGINVGPAWAPDSRRIAFVSATPNRMNPTFGPTESRLIVAPTTGRGRRVVFRTSGAMSRPTWAPDGRRIAVVAGGYLLIIDTATRTGRVVGPAPGSLPAWSPDGREIAFGEPIASSSCDPMGQAGAQSDRPVRVRSPVTQHG